MIYRINPSEYHHVTNITFNGIEFSSYYNHNYFYNEEANDLICEECDDDNGFSYYRISVIDNIADETYHGFVIDNDYAGIFGEDFYDINENGEVELNSEFC